MQIIEHNAESVRDPPQVTMKLLELRWRLRHHDVPVTAAAYFDPDRQDASVRGQRKLAGKRSPGETAAGMKRDGGGDSGMAAQFNFAAAIEIADPEIRIGRTRYKRRVRKARARGQSLHGAVAHAIGRQHDAGRISLAGLGREYVKMQDWNAHP